jgi:hypothetical protein
MLITGPKTYTDKYILSKLRDNDLVYKNYILFGSEIVPVSNEEDVYRLINSPFHEVEEREEFHMIYHNLYRHTKRNSFSNRIYTAKNSEQSRLCLGRNFM